MSDVQIKPQVYKDQRPPEYFDQFHARTRSGPPEPVYEVVRAVTGALALTAFRARGVASENVPNGPVILAPNHASFMDHFFIGAFIRRRIQFMAKSQLFKPGVRTWVFSHGGVFPVRRGHHDEEAFITSFKILDRGGACHVLRGRPLAHRRGGRQAKPGIGRLALESGAPVVPIAIVGSHQVRNWKRLQFPGSWSSTASRSGFRRCPSVTRASSSRRRRTTSSRQDPATMYSERRAGSGQGRAAGIAPSRLRRTRSIAAPVRARAPRSPARAS